VRYKRRKLDAGHARRRVRERSSRKVFSCAPVAVPAWLRHREDRERVHGNCRVPVLVTTARESGHPSAVVRATSRRHRARQFRDVPARGIGQNDLYASSRAAGATRTSVNRPSKAITVLRARVPFYVYGRTRGKSVFFPPPDHFFRRKKSVRVHARVIYAYQVARIDPARKLRGRFRRENISVYVHVVL